MVLARVLVVDAPWTFSDKLPGKKRGSEKHYKCMSVSEIARMPLPPIHDDAVLFFWRVSSMVEEAYQVIRAWDFVPKSEIVWNKTDESGEKDSMGMGRIVRGSHETCVVAARGKYMEPTSKSERTSFRAPRGKHSEKPEEFYRIVERLYPLELWPESHVEVFARRRRRGWIQIGDELPPEEATSEPKRSLEYIVKSGETSDASLSPVQQTTLYRNYLRTSWRETGHLVARDAIEDARGSTDQPSREENLSSMVTRLSGRAYDVPLPAITRMSPVQRGVLQAFLDQPGSDPPEFLQPFQRGAPASGGAASP